MEGKDAVGTLERGPHGPTSILDFKAEVLIERDRAIHVGDVDNRLQLHAGILRVARPIEMGSPFTVAWRRFGWRDIATLDDSRPG